MSDKQIALDSQGGDPRRRDAQDDIALLREGGQTNYEGTLTEDELFSDGVQRVKEAYSTHDQRYPLNPNIATRVITGRWDVPFTANVDTEVVVPLLPDPLTGYGRKSIMIYNNSSVIIYLGMNNSVSSARDWPIPPAGTFVLDKDASTGIWLISTPSVVADVRFVMEMGFVGGLQGRSS